MTDDEKRRNSVEKPFIEHLEDLRVTIFKVLAAAGVCSIVCIAFSKKIFWVLMQPLNDIEQANTSLVVLGPQRGFMIIMGTAVIAGVILSLPVSIYFIGQFILPALKKNEKKLTVPAIGTSAVLFLSGVVFCYFVTLPLVLDLLWRFNQAFGFTNMWTVNEYLGMVTKFMIANGLIFELPLVLLVLVKLGVLTPEDLKSKRKYAIFMMFILGALLSPPDVPSMILVASPMIILYEASVHVAAFLEKKKPST
jgi:sec-independent protein translocase protein TatC